MAIDYTKPSACEQHSGPMSPDETEPCKQVFTVEPVETSDDTGMVMYQSVFPEDMAEYSTVHRTLKEAYSYLCDIRGQFSRTEEIV
jgi:hypothetical protein